tara:strand:- start:836 stop:1534 length:699 start_codon:yes stop_codon:yes gene_type:complete
MKPSISIFSAILVLFAVGCSEQPSSVPDNTLTDAEKAEGWALLFDGNDLSSWRNYQAETIGEQWQVADGAFTLTAKGGGDIITKEQYGAFELVLDWKISPAGNSGIMFHVTEEEKRPWQTGPEIQIQDHSAGHDPQKAGWLYQLYEADVDTAKPAGEWNTFRVVITPEICEQYVNGTKYYEYVKGSADWDAKVAASKFSAFPNFGKPTKGHICFQDHGNVVSFRNVKIKSLD